MFVGREDILTHFRNPNNFRAHMRELNKTTSTTKSLKEIDKANRPRKQLESSAPLGFVASGTYKKTQPFGWVFCI